MRTSFLIFLTTLLLAVPRLNAELPTPSQQLLAKLKAFETEEKAKLQATLDEKRAAVIELLRKQVADETRKGNIDGAMAIYDEIAALGGDTEEMKTGDKAAKPAASWDIPKDAIRYKGDYYKCYPFAEALSWDQARQRCQALGGDLAWLDNEGDVEFLVKIMQPVVDLKGHAPIWIGGVKNQGGEWTWLSGKKVANDFWATDSHKISPGNDDVMIRWIASFRASGRENARVVGFVCRWKR